MWNSNLTRADKKHLKEMGITTLNKAKSNASAQAKMRAEKDYIEPCWDCKRINEKLGLEV